jgi:hypothetical protein
MNDVDTPSIEEVFRSLSLALFGGPGTGGAKSETGHLTCDGWALGCKQVVTGESRTLGDLEVLTRTG